MTDQELIRRLVQLPFVLTPVHAVRNNIVRVDPEAVVVESERTRRARTIPFRDLRAAPSVTRNGVGVAPL
jgi:hypothetical protein